MKLIWIVCFIFWSVAHAEGVVQKRFLTQPLDHFDSSSGTYSQEIEIFIPDGVLNNAPVIFFLTGEGGPLNLVEQASIYIPEHKAIFIQAYHRGYGSYSEDADQSLPTYVNSRQAIEDFHRVITEYKTEFSGPWAVVGYSYPGSLAIELAAKYPLDVKVVVSSSGVVDFPLFSNAHDLLMQSDWPSGLYPKMVNKIQLLNPVDVLGNNWEKLLFLQYIFVGTVQYAKFNSLTGVLQQTSALPVDEFVSKWRELDQNYAGGLAQNWSQAQSLKNLTLQQAKTKKFHSRYWAYQQCAELGNFLTSSSRDQIFTQTSYDYNSYCNSMFGLPKIGSLKQSLKPSVASMKTPIIYIAGEKDPWFGVGLKPGDLRPAGEYFLVKDGRHCPDRDDPILAKKVVEATFNYLIRD